MYQMKIRKILILFINKVQQYDLLVLLTVFRYGEYRFVLVEKTKSEKNIWEPVIVKSYYFRPSNG